MGAKHGVLLALGVLLVVTWVVPLSAATPRTLTDPGVQKIQKMAEDGKEEADKQAEEAQKEAANQAAWAHRQASNAKHEALARAEEAKDAAGGATGHLLASAGRAAAAAMAAVEDALCRVLCPSEPWDPGRRDTSEAEFQAQTETVVPVSPWVDDGVALVVAAGAVGGALLWVVVLQRSVLLGVIPLLSRIAHSEIYMNEARRLIAQIASENPGLCLNEIVARTGYSRNAVSYHLFVLEKEEAIVSIKDGKYRRYFPRGGKYVNGAKNVVSALRNETTLKMAQHIVARPGTIQRELCQVLGTTASAACWHAKRLEQLGVIRKERVANTVRYYPGDALGRHDYSEFGLVAGPEPGPLPGPLPA